MTFRSRLRYFIWRLQTPPLSYLSEILWIVVSGWSLFLYYLFASLCFVVTLIFIPFSWNLLKLAIFSFDPMRFDIRHNIHLEHDVLQSPTSPYVLAANIVWFIFFGWHLFIWHIVLAFIQAITIVGIGNSARHVEIAFKTLFPFGKSIVRRGYPPRPVQAHQNDTNEILV